ncbi:MAG: bacillithiol biosynthesis cysteine-adding enzyme BshC [Balneolaceae bacterium]|nr:bacillithiol biosynthesis cysteine-adding enzyme BshC [Balneolaceae bacterium]MCH8547356.1 bacillithiol biosynthesis cysteine-adding enzyme BshC [Balneolaceae bacterium]
MDFKPYPFERLHFSKLFKDYSTQNSNLLSFFESNPFDEDAVKKHAEEISFMGDRKRSAEAILAFNSSRTLSSQTRKNIDLLAEPESLVVATGQQSTLLGGPFFTVYKAMTAIILSERYRKVLDLPVVPVFWLADEDHDYEEVASLTIKNRNHVFETGLSEIDGVPRVSEVAIDSEVTELKQKVRESLPDTDFSDELWSLINRWYKGGETITSSFAGLMNDLFGKYGLVIAGSNSDEIKELVKPVIQKSISDADSIQNALEQQSKKLEESGYGRQVVVQSSNLFYIDEDGDRLKLNREGEKWHADRVDGSRLHFTSAELISEADQIPNRFSPNVFLRPVIQDRLLPVLAYVGGPGEIAYYAQMKQLYPQFGQKMPVIAPRFSATVIESGVSRVMDQLPFEFHEYGERIEDLNSKFIKQADTPDVETIFREWKSEASNLADRMKPRIAEIDPTLEGTAGKVSAGFLNELDKLKGKVYRSIKQQESVQLKRIERICQSLYPGGGLQERELAWIWLANKYGVSIFDEILEGWRSASPDHHQLISL